MSIDFCDIIKCSIEQIFSGRDAGKFIIFVTLANKHGDELGETSIQEKFNTYDEAIYFLENEFKKLLEGLEVIHN